GAKGWSTVSASTGNGHASPGVCEGDANRQLRGSSDRLEWQIYQLNERLENEAPVSSPIGFTGRRNYSVGPNSAGSTRSTSPQSSKIRSRAARASSAGVKKPVPTATATAPNARAQSMSSGVSPITSTSSGRNG